MKKEEGISGLGSLLPIDRYSGAQEIVFEGVADVLRKEELVILQQLLVESSSKLLGRQRDSAVS